MSANTACREEDAFPDAFFHIAYRKNCLPETAALSRGSASYGLLFNCIQLNSQGCPNSQPPAKLTPGCKALIVKQSGREPVSLFYGPK